MIRRLFPHLALLLCIAITLAVIVLCASRAHGEDMPDWVLPGILAVETRSHYDQRGLIVYRDRQDSTAGAVGPFQMRPIAFAQIGRRAGRARRDMAFAESSARKYLGWLYDQTGDWDLAVAAYFAGLAAAPAVGADYLARVRAIGALMPGAGGAP